MFRALRLENFPPFSDSQLAFHEVEAQIPPLAEVHLFTGVNGTGKTRLLCLLAALLGNPSPLKKRLKGLVGEAIFWIPELVEIHEKHNWQNRYAIHNGGAHWTNSGPMARAATDVPAFAYSGTAYITDAPVNILADMPKPSRNACLEFFRVDGVSQSLLQAITNLKIVAGIESTSPMEATERKATTIMKALESAITDITGIAFAFLVNHRPKVELSVLWGVQTINLDALPDGLRSILGWLAHAVVMMDAWMQGKSDPLNAKSVFLLDEIECHLHPAWQRRILPAFQKLFPNAQIFIATHSPFVIASLNHGWIHRLSMKNGKAILNNPFKASEGDSYISVVEDIMGVKEWYDPETESLLCEFRKQRDLARSGDAGAIELMQSLAERLCKRSVELSYMMGKEMSQFRNSSKPAFLQ